MTHDYTFKTYIANGREYYEYSVNALTWTEHNVNPRLSKKTSRFRKAFCLCCIWIWGRLNC